MSRYTQTKIARKTARLCIPCGFEGHACTGHDPVCPYCNEDPCSCPLLDVLEEDEIPDDRIDCDADEPSDEPDL